MSARSDYERVIQTLDKSLVGKLQAQVLDPERPDDGGRFSPDLGFAGSSTNSFNLLAQSALAYVTPESRFFEDEEILERTRRAAAFQRRVQRPSGLFDLHRANFDSPPDTAFAISTVARVARIVRNSNAVKSDEIEAALEPLLVDAAEGMARGGFHTANHRWVIVDAIAKVHELYPRETFIKQIERYLSETIDINDDGEYTERSHAIYTNIVNRHLIGASLALDRPALLDPVRRSLHSMMDLMDDDWSVVTAFSTRRDRDDRTIPVRGAANFYYMARRDDDERLAAGANALLDEGGWDRGDVAMQLLSYFARHPEWRESDLQPGQRETSFTREMTESGIWRLRDGALSATVGTTTKNVVSFSYGDAKLAGLQVLSPYFGGEFRGGDIEFGADGPSVSVESNYWHEELPGYFDPLDRPVEWGELDLDARSVNERPDFDIDVDVERVDRGLDVTVSATGGLSQVPFAVEARFQSGGTISFDGATLPAPEDDPVFHESGTLYYRYEDDAISIGPGFSAHRCSDAPGADDSGSLVRVLMTDWSPMDRTISVRGGPWFDVAGPDQPAGPSTGFDE
jgi:hypothetical protein